MKKIIYLSVILVISLFFMASFESVMAQSAGTGFVRCPTGQLVKETEPCPSGGGNLPTTNDPTQVKSGVTVPIKLPNPLGSVSTIPQLIDRISDWLLGLATALLPLMIVWGAFKILVSGGKPETVKEGREIITYAVLGYALLLISKGIILIIKEVLGAGGA